MIITFRGEESARFSRFAKEALSVCDNLGRFLYVTVNGRNPLTLRPMCISGRVKSYLLDGYRRHVEIIDEGSGVSYWAAGTNSTNGIATVTISFDLDDEVYFSLKKIAQTQRRYIPQLVDRNTMGDVWHFIDQAPLNLTIETAAQLVEYLKTQKDEEIIRETALDLRAFSDVIIKESALRKDCERSVLNLLNRDYRLSDVKTALVELLGYNIGSALAISKLRDIMFDDVSLDDEKWAAVIAIGRISSPNVDQILLKYLTEKFNADVGGEHREELRSHEWLEAATILSLSRRITFTNEDAVEDEFCERLTDRKKFLHRYIYLGFSKMSSLRRDTIERLIDKFDSAEKLPDKGFCALAIIGKILPTDKPRLSSVLEKLLDALPNDASEPDDISAIEFCAELASSVDNALAVKYHNKLANLFVDWRMNYYSAVAIYERVDNLFSSANRDIFFETADYVKAQLELGRALDLLTAISKGEDDEISAIITFRLELIKARLHILNAIMGIGMNTAHTVREYLRLAQAIYSTYAVDSVNISIRERLYIDGALKQVTFIIEIVDWIHSVYQNKEDSISGLNHLFENTFVIENDSSIVEIYHNNFIEMERALRKILNCEYSVEWMENVTKGVNALRDCLSRLMWIVPVRACMLNGLGKAIVSVKFELSHGSGTQHDPYVWEDTTIVVNTDITVCEMASTARAMVVCKIGDYKQSQPLTIVEGSTIMSFCIPAVSVLSQHSLTKIEVYVEFSLNDVSLINGTIEFYMKKGVV